MNEMVQTNRTSLDDRVKQLDDRGEAVILERIHAWKELDYDHDRLNASDFSVRKTLGKLSAIAVELDLIGEQIQAISNGAYYTDVNPSTGQMTLKSAFGVLGRLEGFDVLEDSRDNFVYVFSMNPVNIESKLGSGLVTPKAFSLVAMGGLTSYAKSQRPFGLG